MTRTLIASSISIFCVSAVHAGYTVMDDDLFPTNAIPASVAAQAAAVASLQQGSRATLVAPPASNDGTYPIPFRRGLYGLNTDGIRVLRELLPQMQGRKLIITGRPDAAPNSYLANQRSIYLRTWLLKQGIPAENIEVAVLDVPTTSIGESTDPQPGKPVLPLFSVDLRIVGTPTYPAMQAAHRASMHAADSRTTIENGIRTTVTSLPAPASNPTVAIIATPSEPDSRLELIRKIVDASMQGRMDAKVAVFTIGELISNVPAGTQKPTAPTPAAAMGLVAAPETMRPKEWVLASDKTLKDSTTEWAKASGYEMDWKATNYYKVQRTRTITTGMLKDLCPANARLANPAPKDRGPASPAAGTDTLDVIDCVTSVVGLDMNVWRRDKLICIGDANTDQCKARQSH